MHLVERVLTLFWVIASSLRSQKAGGDKHFYSLQFFDHENWQGLVMQSAIAFEQAKLCFLATEFEENEGQEHKDVQKRNLPYQGIEPWPCRN